MNWAARTLCLFFILAGALAASAQEPDVSGSADHPMVGRYQGAVIKEYLNKAYDEVAVPFKAIGKGEKATPSAWQENLAGEVTSIRYEGPAGRSILEVMRNYEASLKKNGFSVVFFCRGEKECAPGAIPTFWEASKGATKLPSIWRTTHYLLAERDDPAKGKLTVALLGVESPARGDKPVMPHVAATIVQAKPMEEDKIAVVEADAMEKALTANGKIAIYGLYFDFDSSALKPESKPQLDQLGALLKDKPDLRVLIVGHTDGKGAFDYNLSLSQQRAQSVVDALKSQYGIAGARMMPAGAGMVSPVATNRTEGGRAKNRRVEIVELYSDG